MPGSDVSRLVLQVDASVELARRNLSALAAAVEGDSKKMDASLKRVDDAHARLAKTSGSTRIAQMELMHVITASSDAMSAGMSPSRVFAMEIGRIAEAAQLAAGSGGLGGFARYLTGGYGIALQFGVGLLGMLLGSHRGAGEAAKEHKTGEEALAETLKKVSEATAHLNDNELVSIQRNIDATRSVRSYIDVERERQRVLLQGAIATEEATKRRLEASVGPRGNVNPQALSDYNRQRDLVNDLRSSLAKLEADIPAAQRANAEAELKFAKIIADARSSPENLVEFQSKQRELSLDQEFRRRTKGRDITPDDMSWLLQREDELRRQREAGMRAAQQASEAEHRLTDNREQGRQVTLAEAESIVRGIGGRVTSAQRSTATQAELYARYRAGTGPLAAAPGHSFHETGQALDIAKGGGMSLGRIREAFRTRGIEIRELLDEGNHFHVAFGKSGPSGDELARHAEAARQKRIRDQEYFDESFGRAQEQLAGARRERGMSVSDTADLEAEQVRMERARLNAAALAARNEGRITDAQAQELIALNGRVTQAKIANIRAKAGDQIDQNRLAIQSADLRSEGELARLRADLAETAKARRDAAVSLLDLAQRQERIELEAVLASSQATAAQKEIARRRLAILADQRALGVQAIDRQYEGPGARYARALRNGLADIDDRVQSIEVHALTGLEDSLARSATNALHLHGILGTVIEDLLRIVMERNLILPLADGLLGGGKGGSGGGFLGSVTGFLTRIAGGGSVSKSASSAGLGALKGFASGGEPPVGVPSLVGERGPEVIVPKAPSIVIPNHMIGRGGGRDVIEVHVTGNEMFDVHVQRVSAATVAAAAPAIAGTAGRQVIRLMTRQRIPG